MEPITKMQLSCIVALMAKLKLAAEKETLVSSYSDGRATSRTDLSRQEATELIRYLKSLDPDEVKAEKMRRKIISHAHEMAWHLPGTQQADMRRIDNWCQKYGYKKKKLNSYTFEELPSLVTQMDEVYRTFLESA